jgi:hypothetical protein
MASLINASGATGTGSLTIQGPNTNSNQVLTIPDATGTAMVSGNMPAFSANGNTSTPQSISTATFTKILLPTVNFDTNSNFSSSRFTPTVAGYYIITAGVGDSTGAASGSIECAIYKNNARFAYTVTLNNGFGEAVSLSQVIYFNGTTDQVELWIYQTSGSNMNIGGASTSAQGVFLTGCLMRAA